MKSSNSVDISLLKRVTAYLKPYKKVFLFTLSSTVLLAALSPVRPWLIQYTFDHQIVESDYQGLINMTILLIVVLLVETVVQFYNTYQANWLGQTVVKDLRGDVFKHIINFKLGYFDRTPIGTVVTRVISDIETIAEIFSQGLLVIFGDLLKIIVIIGVMLYTDVKLTLVSLLSLPLLLFSANIFKNAVKSAFKDVRNQVARLNAFVQEHITGMNIVQLFNREKVEMEKFETINALHRDANIRSVWHYSVFLPVVEILSAISIGLLLWWGAKGYIGETVTFGNIVAFILYLHMLFRPIRELADKFNTVQMGLVSSERVFKVLDTDAFISNDGNKKLDNTKGEIEFKNIWFQYQPDEWILKDISFKVKSGETVAVVGATGSGKTTLINILSRFYEYQKGGIYIDGEDLRSYEVKSLRDSICVVLQDVFLFSDTIKNNITLHNASIPDDAVIEASKFVGAHDFISKLNEGYNYNVRERGGMLSSGQRQLLAFIRAYLYQPKILILDEATSSIDPESEMLIQKAIDKITKGRTSIIIAHRLSTVINADKIILMDKGEIKEMGSHQELLGKESGLYKKLFETQFLQTLEN